MGIDEEEESSLDNDEKSLNFDLNDQNEEDSVGTPDGIKESSVFTLAGRKKSKSKIQRPTPLVKKKKSRDKFTISQEDSDGKSLRRWTTLTKISIKS